MKTKGLLIHNIKVIAITIVVCVIIGFSAQIIIGKELLVSNPDRSIVGAIHINPSILIANIPLNVPVGSRESEWTEALASHTKGKSEVRIDFGRVDVVTEDYAIEIDFLKKWKEGLGQALHYGNITGKIPVVALVVTEQPDEDLLKYVDNLCRSNGVKVVLLTPSA